MKDIFIIGAGGFGREVYSFLRYAISLGAQYNFKGFLDDRLDALDKFNYPMGVVGSISDYQPKENEYCILAIVAPNIKKEMSERMLAKGVRFETFIHPTAMIGVNINMGQGVVVCPFVSIPCDSVIGDFATINVGCTVGHDAEVGRYTTLSCGCDITGNVKLGEGVFFASNIAVVPSAKVGDWARIGINSFVIGKVKGEKNYLGNPIRPFM